MDLGNLIVIGKFQKPADVGVDQAFRNDAPDLAFRRQNFANSEAGQDAFLVVAARPNDDTGNPQVQQVHRSQHGGFEVFANRHHGGVHVLYVLRLQSAGVRCVHGDRECHLVFDFFRTGWIGIEGEYFSAFSGQGQSDLAAISANSKNSESRGFRHGS